MILQLPVQAVSNSWSKCLYFFLFQCRIIPKLVHIRVHHYRDIIMSATASQIASLTVVYSTVLFSEHQSSTSQTFVRGIHRWPVNSPRKGPVTWKMFPFVDVIMIRSRFGGDNRLYRLSKSTCEWASIQGHNSWHLNAWWAIKGNVDFTESNLGGQ